MTLHDCCFLGESIESVCMIDDFLYELIESLFRIVRSGLWLPLFAQCHTPRWRCDSYDIESLKQVTLMRN